MRVLTLMTLLVGAIARVLMLDLDQAVLNRENGADLVATENKDAKTEKFVTEAAANARKQAFDRKHRGQYPSFVVSKLPVGTRRRHPKPNAETWMLVSVRDGITEIVRDAIAKGWRVGVNTAMNPVHGQAVVEELGKIFGEGMNHGQRERLFPEHLRYFRTSTCRNLARGEKYGGTNIKDYDIPTWQIRLDFKPDYKNAETGKWYYQYLDIHGRWKNLKLDDAALGKFCSDGIADNLFPTYLADELQYLIATSRPELLGDAPRSKELYQSVMANVVDFKGYYRGPKQRVASKTSSSWLSPDMFHMIKGSRTTIYDLGYDCLWKNNFHTIDLRTIRQRLGGDRVSIIHFDDKDFDVRLPGKHCLNRATPHDKKPIANNGKRVIGWYPRGHKLALQDREYFLYTEDLELLRGELSI